MLVNRQNHAIHGTVWTTDKDGIILALLSAEITEKLGKDPGELYQDLIHEFREPAYNRVEPLLLQGKKRY